MDELEFSSGGDLPDAGLPDSHLTPEMTEVIRRMEVAFMGASELAADRGRSVPAGLPGVPRVPAERTRIEARSRQRAFGVGMFML